MRNIDINYIALKNVLEKKFGGRWQILLRVHPSQAKQFQRMNDIKSIIDVSEYSDSQELASACDIMISDYSSIMFENAFVKKPVFLFATDKKTYIDKEYNFLINYDSLPFPIAETNEELIRNINNFDYSKYKKDLENFLDKYGVQEDGHASGRAADFILQLIK